MRLISYFKVEMNCKAGPNNFSVNLYQYRDACTELWLTVWNAFMFCFRKVFSEPLSGGQGGWRW